jgi:hypothetical protein
MGSLVDELQRREAVARAEAERLRGQIAELAERLAGVEEQLSRLVIAREVLMRCWMARPRQSCHRCRDSWRCRLRRGLVMRL